MNQQNKPEVHLELSCGYFRIPTDNVVYNITVLETQETNSATRLNEKVQTEVNEFQNDKKESPVAIEEKEQNTLLISDDYYKEAAIYYSGEFSRLTTDVPNPGQGDLHEGGAGQSHLEVVEKLDQTNKIVEEAKLKLQDIQGQAISENEELQPEPVAVGQGPALTEGLKDLQANIGKLKNIIKELLENPTTAEPEPVEQVSSPKESSTKTRYLFDLDTVFQTIYELCTNETVKEHSQNARASAADIFDKVIFLDYVSERAGSYSEDDGFLSVPLEDVLTGLALGCSDKKTANLLKNMNKQQADIFLDQFLPLEVPPTEEIEIESEGSQADNSEEEQPPPPSDTSLAEAKELIDSGETSIAALVSLVEEQTQPEGAVATGGLSDDTKTKLGDVSHMLADIGTHITWVGGEVSTISPNPAPEEESVSVLQEIKRTAEALAVCLSEKKNNPDRLFSHVEGGEDPQLEGMDGSDGSDVLESTQEVEEEYEEENEDKKQDEIDDAIAVAASEDVLEADTGDDLEDQLEFAGNDLPVEDDGDDDDFGEASQDDIDKLLEEMG